MAILMSIKPEYVERIFNGSKQYEYRKKIHKDRSVETVVVYSTMPVGKIVGEFKIKEILEDEPSKIWKKTKDFSGISERDYFNYFGGYSKAYAIRIGDIRIYDRPLDLKEYNKDLKNAPQSYRYIEKNHNV